MSVFGCKLEPDPELAALLERARKIPMTREMKREQRISFVHGNQPFDSPGKSREEIRRLFDEDPAFW